MCYDTVCCHRLLLAAGVYCLYLCHAVGVVLSLSLPCCICSCNAPLLAIYVSVPQPLFLLQSRAVNPKSSTLQQARPLRAARSACGWPCRPTFPSRHPRASSQPRSGTPTVRVGVKNMAFRWLSAAALPGFGSSSDGVWCQVFAATLCKHSLLGSMPPHPCVPVLLARTSPTPKHQHINTLNHPPHTYAQSARAGRSVSMC